MEVIQRPDKVVVKTSMPGVNPADIDASVEDNVLALRAEKESEVKEEKEGYLIQ